MTQFEKFEEIKNELIEYGINYKNLGDAELSKTFLNTASLIKELTDTYKKPNFSNNVATTLMIKINHNFNYLKYVMTAHYCTHNITSKSNLITQLALGSFNHYYDFFKFDHTIAMA